MFTIIYTTFPFYISFFSGSYCVSSLADPDLGGLHAFAIYIDVNL
uniref:Uncharacterized protein n=1 Tax=Arundo donax TaxID=35708 RepID=A0A0A8YZI6_ARUDO